MRYIILPALVLVSACSAASQPDNTPKSMRDFYAKQNGTYVYTAEDYAEIDRKRARHLARQQDSMAKIKMIYPVQSDLEDRVDCIVSEEDDSIC